jgi:hypothetical protein
VSRKIPTKLIGVSKFATTLNSGGIAQLFVEQVSKAAKATKGSKGSAAKWQIAGLSTNKQFIYGIHLDENPEAVKLWNLGTACGWLIDQQAINCLPMQPIKLP